MCKRLAISFYYHYNASVVVSIAVTLTALLHTRDKQKKNYQVVLPFDSIHMHFYGMPTSIHGSFNSAMISVAFCLLFALKYLSFQLRFATTQFQVQFIEYLAIYNAFNRNIRK